MHLNLPHKFSKGDAVARVKQALAESKTQIGDKATIEEERWEGDTLVVDVVHFNDQTWFDRAGNFHSEALHLIERYTLMSPDHISYEVTVEDPKVFTRPWKMGTILYRRKDQGFRLLEYECYDYAYEEALKIK